MSKWIKYSLMPKGFDGYLPSKPCVYAVYLDEKLVYIGQTNKLSNRFSGGRFKYGYARNLITPWGEFCEATKVSIKVKFSERYGDWAMWEIRLIHRIQPVFNRHHKKYRGAE
jgi:excinuclease UvrABC nuclease subunit